MSQIWKQLFFTTQFSFADRQITITLGMARGKMRGKSSLWHIILQTPSLCIVTKSGVCKASVWCWCCVMPATVRWYRWYSAGSFLSSPHPHTRAGARGLELVLVCHVAAAQFPASCQRSTVRTHTSVPHLGSVLLSPSEAVCSQGDSSHRFPQLGRINTFYFCQQWLQSRPDVTWRRKAVAAEIF